MVVKIQFSVRITRLTITVSTPPAGFTTSTRCFGAQQIVIRIITVIAASDNDRNDLNAVNDQIMTRIPYNT